MGRLTDKNILITGGNSGIGLATAQEFDREGARVAICGLNERTLQAAKGTLGRYDVRHDQAGVRAPGRPVRKCRLQRVPAGRRGD